MKEPFAILHELTDTQCLITKECDQETAELKVAIKFWCVKMNGYITLTLGFGEDQEDDFNNAFENFKLQDNVIEWIEKFEKQYLTETES